MAAQSSTERRGARAWISRILIALVLVLGVGLRIAGASAKSNLAKQNPAPGQLLDVVGYKMHIYCTGQGTPTVILLAGLDDFSIVWSLVQPQVAKFTRVCSYDRSGLGWSEARPDPRTSENMVRELHTLLVKAQVATPYVMVGHSFGGALVQLYTHTYPDEISGMVLVDATHDELFSRIPPWRNLVWQKIEMFRMLSPLSSFGLLALAPELIPSRRLPDGVVAQYRALSVSTNYFDTGAKENELYEKNLEELRGAHISGFGKLPLIVLSEGVWGSLPGVSETDNEKAWQAWQAMQTELVARSSNSKQVIAEKSGHFIQLQQPDLVIEAIREMADSPTAIHAK